jgi:formyl-CoA transferase
MATEAGRRDKSRPTPLAGVRVLDLTNVLAGPFACHQLAHLGAEVIKIEAVGRGDLARNLGADPELSSRGMGISFLAQNAGKRSLTLNLKDARGKDILRRLAREAGVLVENFRPGVMDRLGLGPDVLRGENPRLIYCAISGFGQDGPLADRPAYDQIVQGLSGVMSITGDAASAPLRVGYPLADTVGGLTAAMAICAALNVPEKGTVIDVSMLDSVLATMGWVVSNHLIGGVAPQPNGNENPTSAPSGTFQCADAPINISANKDDQWVALARHLGREDLLADPRFATREDRKANRLRLRPVIDRRDKSRLEERGPRPLDLLAGDHEPDHWRKADPADQLLDGPPAQRDASRLHVDDGSVPPIRNFTEIGHITPSCLNEAISSASRPMPPRIASVSCPSSGGGASTRGR